MKKILFSIVALLMISAVTAQEEGIKPDSKLYFFDRAGEAIGEVIITFNPLVSADYKAEYHLKLAEERVAEAIAMQNESKTAGDLLLEADREDIKSDTFGSKISDLAKRKAFQEKKELILQKRLQHIERMETKKGVALDVLRQNIAEKRNKISDQIKNISDEIRKKG